ncbi:10698_t:CDS:1, partial [Funneliformis geosporum]
RLVRQNLMSNLSNISFDFQQRLVGEIVSIDTEQEPRLENYEEIIQDKIIEVNIVAVKLMSD